MKRGFKTRAEELAVEIRQQLSLRAWERLPAAMLAEKLDVTIFVPHQIDDLEERHLNVLLQTRSEEWSAATLVNAEGRPVVICNPSHSPKRTEADLMHELAHILLKHRPSAFNQADGVGVLIRGYDPEQEDEANWLGQCLHLPRPMLSFCLNRAFSHEQISDYAHASAQLVQYRLNISGALVIRRRMARAS